MVVALLEALGKKDIAEKIKPIVNFPTTFLDAFHIPADADDTGVSYALAATIS